MLQSFQSYKEVLDMLHRRRCTHLKINAFMYHINRMRCRNSSFSLFLLNVSFFLSVVDTNDRFLRKITVGQASTEKGFSRQVGKVLTVFGEDISFDH